MPQTLYGLSSLNPQEQQKLESMVSLSMSTQYSNLHPCGECLELIALIPLEGSHNGLVIGLVCVCGGQSEMVGRPVSYMSVIFSTAARMSTSLCLRRVASRCVITSSFSCCQRRRQQQPSHYPRSASPPHSHYHDKILPPHITTVINEVVFGAPKGKVKSHISLPIQKLNKR